MGLYDNYKLSNSTGVQPFAGSIVPELKLAKDQADSRYEQSQEGLINLPEVLNQAPINPQDKPVWDKINTEVQERIASWSKRPDLENATIDIYRYSKQVGNKLKTLADQKKARDEYVSSIDKREDIDPLTKQWAKETADADYGQLQFGPDGRPVNTYQGKVPAKQVDKARLIREALSMLEPDGSAEVLGYDRDNHRYSVKTSRGTQWIDENKVLNTIASAKQLNPEWRASDEQEQAVQLYHSTKGITDANVLAQIDSNPTDLEMQQVKRLMQSKGLPASVAYKQLKAEKIKNNLSEAEKQYARSKVFTRTYTSEDVGVGPNWVSDRQQMQDALEIQKAAAAGGGQMPWIRGGDMLPTVSEEEDLTKVEKTVAENFDKKAKLQGETKKLEQDIAAELAKGTKADPRILNSLKTRKENLESEKEAIDYTNNSYNDRINYVKQRAASDLGVNLRDIKATEKARVLKLIGNTTVKGVTPEEIATAASEGNIEIKTETGGHMGFAVKTHDYILTKADGTKINLKNLDNSLLKTKLDEMFLGQSSVFKKVVAKASENWKTYNKEYSQSVPGFMPAPDKEGKIFKEGLESVINSRGSSLKLKVPGKFEEVSSSDIPKDATWDVIDVAPSGKGDESKVRVREMVEGKPTGNIYDAYMPINTYDQLAQLYGSDHSDSNIRTMVKAFRPGSGYRIITSTPNNSTIIKGKDSQFVIQDGEYKLIDNVGNVVKVPDRDAQGNIIKVKDTNPNSKTFGQIIDKTKELRTTDAYEAGEWYETLKR